LPAPHPVFESACAIPGVMRAALPGGEDARGRFTEVFRLEWMEELFGGVVQVNCSFSRAGTLRGLHFHLRQRDLWFLCSGRIRAGVADLRTGAAPARGLSIDLTAGKGEALLIPPGVAHGFLALEDSVLVYVVNGYYDGSDEHGVAWDDMSLGIDWGVSDPILSARDRANPPLDSARKRLAALESGELESS